MTEPTSVAGTGWLHPVPAPPAAGTPESVAEAAEGRVAAALAGIDAATGRPPADQVPVFAAAQQALQATLAGIDEN